MELVSRELRIRTCHAHSNFWQRGCNADRDVHVCHPCAHVQYRKRASVEGSLSCCHREDKNHPRWQGGVCGDTPGEHLGEEQKTWKEWETEGTRSERSLEDESTRRAKLSRRCGALSASTENADTCGTTNARPPLMLRAALATNVHPLAFFSHNVQTPMGINDNDSDNDHSSRQLSVHKTLICPRGQSAWAVAPPNEKKSLRAKSVRAQISCHLEMKWACIRAE